ncbi:MAG: hypothetical protein ACRYG6_02430 [Janthinobacterium lividum]
MPDGLHERDALAWAGRLAAGERLNEAVDWAGCMPRRCGGRARC